MQRVVINIFDVRTGKVMRDFKGTPDDFAIGGTGGVSGVSWPVFRYVFVCSFASYIDSLIFLSPIILCHEYF